MNEPRYTPEEFTRRSGNAKIDTELRRWLRSQAVPQRIGFIEALFPQNYRYALSLVRSSQLPIEEVTRLLQHWLTSASHNCSQGLIEGLIPMLGEARFWDIAAQTELTPAMADFLNYHSHGKLDRYKEAATSAGRQ
ncbi:hypothetical protein GTP41_01805 [Pseudoduganella sp. DS3]|uniref:Uncharacterized protein n=1 Tax=Pseudoduganella guangdongensis TaxID=2692179 RepID=A0A6N9HD87_9BURK|nr:hypothetical protein [Pseudoduganella guangdongensis]MYN00825.1 hypothetical protein [Pseudoduganella guangdongensis]